MRYKEYNTNRILDKSIAVFWQKGFNGCSIQDLVDATGINRFSLYSEFQNKEGILYASLEQYRDRYCQEKLDLLRENEEVVPALKRFYLSYLDNENPVAGCYYIHVGTELADSNERIKEGLNKYLEEIESGIRTLLIRKGSVIEVDLYAKHLLGLFCTVMSFCLIMTREQREKYITNGINVILAEYATSTP